MTGPVQQDDHDGAEEPAGPLADTDTVPERPVAPQDEPVEQTDVRAAPSGPTAASGRRTEADGDLLGEEDADAGADPAQADDGDHLRESHAWEVSEEAVRALPPEEAAPSPASSADLASGEPTSARDGSHPEDATGAPPAAHPARPTGWAALAIALRPRATRAQVLAGVLCAVLGFAIVVQLRQNGDSTLSQLRQDDLVRLLDEASTRSDQLSREAADLQRERDQLVSGSNTRQAAVDAARRSAATQGILAGRLPAVGPGVRITLADPNGSIRPITMLNMLEELRNAGAEAVQLDDHRVTASSAFTGSAGSVQLDGTTLDAPYVWLVIGDPDTIATALDIPGGAMAYVRNDGGTGSVDKLTEVHVDALRPVTDPRYATPVAVPGS